MDDPQIRSLTPAQQEEYARISASLREVKGEIRRMTSVFPPVLRNYASDSVEVSLLKAFDEKDFSPLSFPSTRQMPFFAGKEAHSWLDVRDSLKQTGASIEPTYLFNPPAHPAPPTTLLLKDADMLTYGDNPAEDDLEMVICNLCRKPLLKRKFVSHLERCIIHPQSDTVDQGGISYTSNLSQTFVDQNMAALNANPAPSSLAATPTAATPASSTPVLEPPKKKKKKDEGKVKVKGSVENGADDIKTEEVIDPGREAPIPTVKFKLVSKGGPPKSSQQGEPSFEDEVPLSEKEEIALVLEALMMNKPVPMATKRAEFSPRDTSLWKLRSVISEALSRQHPKQMAAPRPSHLFSGGANQPESQVAPPLTSPALKKKKAKGKNDDDDDDYVRKPPSKKKAKIDDISSPPTSAPPTPSIPPQSLTSSTAPSPGYFDGVHSNVQVHISEMVPSTPSSPAVIGSAKVKAEKGAKFKKGDLASPPGNTILNYFDPNTPTAASTPQAPRPIGRPPIHRTASSHSEASPGNVPSPAGAKVMKKKKGE